MKSGAAEYVNTSDDAYLLPDHAVTVADDSTQSYALYLPSDYTPDRTWNLLLAFHPGARGVA